MRVLNEVTNPGTGSIWGNRSFVMLWLGQCFSQGADRLIFILLVELVTRLDPAPRTLSVALAATTVPNVLFGALAGVWADRIDKRHVMMLSNLVRAGLVLALSLIGGGHVVLAIAIACLIAMAAQPFVPAEAGAIPATVERHALMEANAVSALTMVGAVVVAYTVGEPLIHASGTLVGSVVIAAAFGASTLCLAQVKFLHPPEMRPRTGWWLELKEGLDYIRRRGGVRRTMAFQVIIFSTFAALSVLAILFAKNVLQTNFSWLLASGGVGLGVGAWLIGRWGTRWSQDLSIVTGFAATGAALFGLSGVGPEQTGLAFVLTFVTGFMASVVGVPLQTRLQERVEDALRGKVFGVQNTVLNAVAIIPLAGTGFLLEWCELPTVLRGLSLIMFTTALAAWVARLSASHR